MRPTLRAPAVLGRARRRSSIRTMLIVLAVVPSLALIGLWGFTTSHLWSETSDLKDQNSIGVEAGPAAFVAMGQLQEERRLSAAWLAARDDRGRAELDAARARTDAALDDFTRMLVKFAGTDSDLPVRTKLIEDARGPLAADRTRIDRRDGKRSELLQRYDTIIDAHLSTFSVLARVDSNGTMTYRSMTIVDMFRVSELTAREDAVLTYAIGVNELKPDEYLAFAEAAGARRVLFAQEIASRLEPEFLRRFQEMTAGQPWQALIAAENAVLAMGVDGRPSTGLALPRETADWRGTLDQVMTQLTAFNGERTAVIINASEKRVEDQEFTVWTITALGLAAVVVVSLLSWAVTRSLRRRLLGLHRDTVELAEKRLPAVIARLSTRGGTGVPEREELAAVAPKTTHGNDEIGQVAAAFSTAERAAVDGAVRLAREREGYAKVFHNVALRTQSLVGRQLRVLDAMENRHQDPELLDDLYVLDHLATRLRRYEENLVILSGHLPGRRWSKPVRMVDVVRSAVGEVEDYHRVEVRVGSDLSLAGPAVGGVIHLLAELLENATKFSPPDTPVEVRGMPVATGLAVEIEDRGLGMSAEEFEALNAELADPTPFDMVALADDLRLGLFVVAQLAQRYGISVALRPSPYGGTLAIVRVPKNLIIGSDEWTRDDQDDAEDQDGGTPGNATDTPDGRDADRPSLTPAPDEQQAADPRTPPPATVTRLTIPAPSTAGDARDATDTGGTRQADPANAHVTEEATAEVTGAVERPRAPEHAVRSASLSASSLTSGPTSSRPKPLPRRVRQTHLAAPLRDAPHETADAETSDRPDRPARPTPREAAATISAFQRASERARAAADIITEPPEKDS